MSNTYIRTRVIFTYPVPCVHEETHRNIRECRAPYLIACALSLSASTRYPYSPARALDRVPYPRHIRTSTYAFVLSTTLSCLLPLHL